MKSDRTKGKGISSLDSFWNEQNLKLIANDGFRDDLGNLYDDILYFKHGRGDAKKTLDFSIFDLEHVKVDNVATLTVNCESFSLSMKDYAKLAVVNCITPKNVSCVKSAYNMLVHIGSFLNSQECKTLNRNNLETFHISFLTQSVNDDGWYTRLSPPAFRASYGHFKLHDNRLRLRGIGVSGVLEPTLTKQHLMKTLDAACRSVLGITRLEYAEGGSLNTLTLEMGQYYIDHLKRVYEKDYFYTLICQSSVRNVLRRFNITGYDELALKTISGTIQGKNISLEQKSISGKPKTKKRACEIHYAMKQELFKQYSENFEKVRSLTEENICNLLKELGLDMRFDGVEIIRVLMLQKYFNFVGQKPAESAWKGYLRSIDSSEVGLKHLRYISVDDLYFRMSNLISQHRLKTKDFFSDLHNWIKGLVGSSERLTYRMIKTEFERVQAAMTSLVVAWLGYRESEFGFPLSAIYVEPNTDILDSSHVPFRFKLKWLVPKNNKQTKIDREITSQCYQIAAQLNELYLPAKGEPCLYNARKGYPVSNRSAKYITLRVRSNWSHFVNQYQPFLDVQELLSLSKRPVHSLSLDEKVKLKELKSRYDFSSARVQHLLATLHEVKEDITKLECTAFGGDKKQAAFKASLVEFQNTGDIVDPVHKKIAMECLSDETIDQLLSANVILERKNMHAISKELIRDVRYPTPHAFRHIWAEAVLTRYQGDVGAVIRHQFCHMDDSFFMAYLRDKEVNGLIKAARMKVLNSIVDTLLLEKREVDQEYFGGFARFVKKALSITRAVTSNDIGELRRRITGRLISMQFSHFAACIPREGAEVRAKCYDFGDINPQNAKPSFCLGCTNALISRGNLRGIWMTLRPFVKECFNENAFGFMLESHLPTLRSGYKRIKELQSSENIEPVSRILSLIEKAIGSVEAKIKAEKMLYE